MPVALSRRGRLLAPVCRWRALAAIGRAPASDARSTLRPVSAESQHEEGQTEEIDALAVPVESGSTIEAGSGYGSRAVACGGAAGLPQVSAPRPIAPPARPLTDLRTAPVLQAAAVAAGGFVAGAAVVGLARRRHAGLTLSAGRARRASGRRRGRRAGRQGRRELTQVLASRSFLVDVHLLGPAARGR